MQTLIDSFELGHSLTTNRAFSRSGEQRSGEHPHGPAVITVRTDYTGPRATLLDVDEIAWVDSESSADDDDFEDEVTLELDLDSEMPRKVIAPRGRGARVWTSEE